MDYYELSFFKFLTIEVLIYIIVFCIIWAGDSTRVLHVSEQYSRLF